MQLQGLGTNLLTVSSGTTLTGEQARMPVEAEATHIPDTLPVSVQGLDAGASVLAKDIPLPQGVKLAVDEDTPVLQVLASQTEAAEGTEEEGAEA